MDLKMILEKDLNDLSMEELNFLKAQVKQEKPKTEVEKADQADLIETINAMQIEIQTLKARPVYEPPVIPDPIPEPKKTKTLFKKIDEFFKTIY